LFSLAKSALAWFVLVKGESK